MGTKQTNALKEEKVTVEQFHTALLMCIWAPVNLLQKENQDLLGLFRNKDEQSTHRRSDSQ